MKHSWSIHTCVGKIGGAVGDEDPMSGVSNLFDVALVFIVMTFLFTAGGLAALSASRNLDLQEAVKLQHYRESKLEASGEGERLGAAYRLRNGDVVYVPEGKGAY